MLFFCPKCRFFVPFVFFRPGCNFLFCPDNRLLILSRAFFFVPTPSLEGRDLQIATAAGWDPSRCCPVERQELESWMNQRAGELRVSIEENNAARRLQLITLLAGQRRLHSLEEEDALLEENFCATALGEGRFAPY